MNAMLDKLDAKLREQMEAALAANWQIVIDRQ